MRVLPADVYDTLEFSALAFDGIGAGTFGRDLDHPCCIFGHAATGEGDYTFMGPVSVALRGACINPGISDGAVRSVTRQVSELDPRKLGRITFEQWCAELGVVRGE